MSAIDDKVAALAAAHFAIGTPAGPEADVGDGVGRFRIFSNGAIYWSPATGAHLVRDQILGKFLILRGARSVVGYPTGDTAPTADGTGLFGRFQFGSIYFSPAHGAREVHGDIHGRWAALGFERPAGPFDPGLGYPLTDELHLANNGRCSIFEHGTIYWSPATGPFILKGAVRDKYVALGGGASPLGYPVQDSGPMRSGGGQSCRFQFGSIYDSFATGTHEVHGDIHGLWASLDFEHSRLGLPITDERDGPSTPTGPSRQSFFEHGRIDWTAAGGPHAVFTDDLIASRAAPGTARIQWGDFLPGLYSEGPEWFDYYGRPVAERPWNWIGGEDIIKITEHESHIDPRAARIDSTADELRISLTVDSWLANWKGLEVIDASGNVIAACEFQPQSPRSGGTVELRLPDVYALMGARLVFRKWTDIFHGRDRYHLELSDAWTKRARNTGHRIRYIDFEWFQEAFIPGYRG